MSNENPTPPPNDPQKRWPVPPLHGPESSTPPPGSYPQQPQANSTLDNVIPTKNPAALTAYYLGVLSIALGFLGPFAIGFGIKGLNNIKKQQGLPGKTHAMIGIVLGGFCTILWIFLYIFLVKTILFARTA